MNGGIDDNDDNIIIYSSFAALYHFSVVFTRTICELRNHLVRDAETVSSFLSLPEHNNLFRLIVLCSLHFSITYSLLMSDKGKGKVLLNI